MKIAVLMSTYNGEKYLKEQIDSILLQKLNDDCELVLFIRDDGSTDQTMEIIEEYVENRKDIICINDSASSNIGIKESFLLLLRTASEYGHGFDYYSFSDQDDVWLEDKLDCAIEKLKKSNNKKGALYYSNKFIVDEDLNIQKQEHLRYYGDFIEVLWRSLAFGCTMIFNDQLAKYALLYDSKISHWHDSWIYRVAKCIGSDIIFDENAHIYYRQHLNNIIGEEECSPHHGLIYMAQNFFLNIIKPRKHFYQNSIKEISNMYQAAIDQNVKYYIDLVLSYNKSSRSKWSLLTIRDMKKRPLMDRLIWTYKILFNMI